jgi:hypothetical protein
MFNFEKLEVWRETINFADLVYSVTRAFPGEGRFGLTNQMRRAADSLSSNNSPTLIHSNASLSNHF